MKKVIIASYLFPPSGGKAVQRASKLAKYLPEFDIQPIIFTMPLSNIREVTDQFLLDELPPDIMVHRPKYRDYWLLVPHDIRKYVYHPLPDRHIAWAKACAKDLIKLINDTGAQALITTSPSHSTQLLGLAAKRATNIPWIADFRDQWTGHPDFSAERGSVQIRRMEREVLNNADAVTVVIPRIKRDFATYISEEKITVIENGFDPDDFSGIENAAGSDVGATLRIGYNGTGSVFHNPAPLLSAVSSLLESGNIHEDDIRIVFTGNANMDIFRPFSHLIARGIVILHGYTPHVQSLERMATMDVSLLLVTKGRDIYTGKVFEYLYLGKPILVLGTPGDDLSQLIEQTDSGIVVDHRDHDSIAREVVRLIEMKRRGEMRQQQADLDKISRFSRREIAGRFSDIIKKIASPVVQRKPAEQ
jgi:glycosyltransferase involved in cell wall biosynthesis